MRSSSFGSASSLLVERAVGSMTVVKSVQDVTWDESKLRLRGLNMNVEGELMNKKPRGWIRLAKDGQNTGRSACACPEMNVHHQNTRISDLKTSTRMHVRL